ncbi:ral guanine nucleotide dissociation stimulator-like [Dasypus novemcinctus]|uniref:ral guanine nucleotide dissociation stimulator-like n=1 Tax=Dasypus novemcinctus TaxID=9361 RepID=UPI00265DDEC1|nr:ral guanine nucleotide dissociation stimulator-like [Dasypus novemcinctus]
MSDFGLICQMETAAQERKWVSSDRAALHQPCVELASGFRPSPSCFPVSECVHLLRVNPDSGLTSSTQVVSKELEEGLVYTGSLRNVMVHPGPGQGMNWFQRKNEGALARGESRAVRTVQAGRWEDLVEHLVPALQEGDLGYVCNFLETYGVFASTEQVLDWLFHRFGGDLGGKGEPPGRLDVKTTLCTLLGTWMDQYWEDFLQPPDSPCLQLLAAHAQEHLPGSGPQFRVVLLLAWMRHPEPTEAEPEAPLSAPEPPMPPVRPPVPVPTPAADTGPEPESAPSPPGMPAGEVVPVPPVQIEPDVFCAGAPAPELQVAPAPPQLPPTEMGPVPSLERDCLTRSAGAPA